MWTKILLDALLAAIAAIGFSAISRPPLRVIPVCALIAAIGHALRFWLMNDSFGAGLHIIAATLIAALTIGVLAVFLSPLTSPPAETCLFPSLLPMIPGIYAYKTFGGAAMCVLSHSREAFDFYFYQFALNGSTCVCILLCMVIGATLPIFLFEKISFQATRPGNNA